MPSKRPQSPSSADDSPLEPLKSHKRSRPRSSRPLLPLPLPLPRQSVDPDHHPRSSRPPFPARKSDRKPKPRAFPDNVPPPAFPRRIHAGAVQKLWTDADEINLLTGAAAFRSRTGQVPRLPDMGVLYESIKSSLSPHIDQAKVYYKLKRLKSKFLHTAPASSASLAPHFTRIRELCADVWGAPEAPSQSVPPRLRQSPTIAQYLNGDDLEYDDEEEYGYGGREEENATAVSYPVMSEVLGQHWKADKHGLSGVSLEKGIKVIDEEDGRVLEGKWRRQVELELRTGMRRLEMGRDIYGMLLEAVKGLGP